MSFYGDGGPISIRVTNEAKTPLGVDLDALIAALNIQVANHFAPFWGVTASVNLGIAGPGEWSLVLLDNADQADALGYHDLTDDGQPRGKMFVATTIEDKQLVSVTTSHELLEMLVDPGIQMCADTANGTIYAYEVCDAVENNTYEINGVTVSDFVTPAWFEEFRKPNSEIFDYLKQVTQPFELLPGGYIGVMKHGRWSQIFADKPRHRPRNRQIRRSHKGL
jgi:hypothetical protein